MKVLKWLLRIINVIIIVLLANSFGLYHVGLTKPMIIGLSVLFAGINIVPSLINMSIKKGKLNDAMVASSAFYHKIKDRYESFSYDNLTTLNYTDAIIDFNASLINSKLKSDYLLFEERPTGEYNHLGIALDSINGVRYAETFIHNTTDMYIKGQTVVKIKNFKIVDKNGNIFIEDSF